MDVHMPVMDGLEATDGSVRWVARRIGSIVAMTANAMTNDRDECLAAHERSRLQTIDPDAFLTVVARYVEQGGIAPCG